MKTERCHCGRTFKDVRGLHIHQRLKHKMARRSKPLRQPAGDDPMSCPWGCGHRAVDVAERNRHALAECPQRVEPEPERSSGRFAHW